MLRSEARSPGVLRLKALPDTEKEVVDTYTALAHVHSESGNAAAARTYPQPSQPALARGEECTVVEGVF